MAVDWQKAFEAYVRAIYDADSVIADPDFDGGPIDMDPEALAWVRALYSRLESIDQQLVAADVRSFILPACALMTIDIDPAFNSDRLKSVVSLTPEIVSAELRNHADGRQSVEIMADANEGNGQVLLTSVGGEQNTLKFEIEPLDDSPIISID